MTSAGCSFWKEIRFDRGTSTLIVYVVRPVSVEARLPSSG